MTSGAAPRLQLAGFNNLTKPLSFNSYEVGYAATPEQQKRYMVSIDEAYNAERLTGILSTVARIIGANILNIAHQDYEPQGASVALLLAEQSAASAPSDFAGAWPGRQPDAVLCHLDKSHITVHTYPESCPDNGVNTFRADIEVSTCGRISPLKAINYLVDCFKSDMVSIDYRVRGFTRDATGKSTLAIIRSARFRISCPKDIGERYQMIDVNIGRADLSYQMLRKRLIPSGMGSIRMGRPRHPAIRPELNGECGGKWRRFSTAARTCARIGRFNDRRQKTDFFWQNSCGIRTVGRDSMRQGGITVAALDNPEPRPHLQIKSP